MTALQQQGAAAKAATYALATASTAVKNAALEAMAQALIQGQEDWLSANAQDVAAAREQIQHPILLRSNHIRFLNGTINPIIFPFADRKVFRTDGKSQ